MAQRNMRQVSKVQISPTKMKDGQPAMALMFPEANVYVAYTSPETLKSLSVALDQAAKELLIKQRHGSTKIFLPSGQLARSVAHASWRN